jgi:outer membrane protein assembly factor BamD
VIHRLPRFAPARRAWLAALVLAGLTAACAHAPHKPRAEMPTGDIIAYGKAAFERHEYADAIEFFKGYVTREPTGEKADEAHYDLGLCYFHTTEWPSAATEFQIVINEFAGSTFVPDAHYYLGLSLWKEARPSAYDQDYTRRALDEFEHFLALYPDHPRADEVKRARAEARSRLAKKLYDNGRIYAKLGYYTPARTYFQEVQTEFPDTPWNAWALLGEAQSWAKQKYWEESNAALERLAASTPPPPEEVASEAKKLASYVKGRLVASRGGASPASAP